MINRAAIILSILAIFSFTAPAQVQKGIVRTIERPGRAVKYVDGATIRAQGLHNAAVSDAGGAFALDFGSVGIHEGEAFKLSRVNKSGYELSDKGAIGKEYAFSVSVPLEIVLINIAEREADKQRIADKAYARAEQTYKTKLADLERRLGDKSIDAETYRTQLRDLQDKFDKYEKLIDAMAERYASADYANLDHLNARVNIAIENGELELADSLIRSVGSLEALVSQNMEAMRRADAKQKLARTLVAAAQQDKDSIAADRQRLGDLLYSKAQIHLAAFENDSTAHYYRLRAELDTTNVDWQLEAGVFFDNYLANYNAAMTLYHKALQQSLRQNGSNTELTAKCYINIGSVYDTQGDFDNALEYFNKALNILQKNLGKKHPIVANCYNNIGVTYDNQGDYGNALEYHSKALHIWRKSLGEKHNYVALCYNNIGTMYDNQGNHAKALEHHIKALNIWIDNLGKNHSHVATSYNNIGLALRSQDNYDKALEYFNKALNIRKKIFGEKHPYVASCYNNIGMSYADKGNYAKALRYYEKALKIRKEIFLEKHPDIATCYNNIGLTYAHQADYPLALEFSCNALNIFRETLGHKHPDVAICYNNIGGIYNDMGDYNKALEYYDKALKIRKEIFGIKHKYTISSLVNIYRTLTHSNNNSTPSEKYSDYIKDKALTATIIDGYTPAKAQGMAGEYYLLEFADWDMNQRRDLFTVKEEMRGKPKSITVMKDGVISTHYFEDSIGCQFDIKTVGEEQKKAIEEAYRTWKGKSE